MLTKLLLQKLQVAEGKVDQLEDEIKSQTSQKSFEDISASINEKLEALDRVSKDSLQDRDSISEETPKESTKLSDQFSQDKSDTINQLSAISNSTMEPILPIPGIEFGVAQSPVRLSENEIDQLPDIGSTFSSTLNTSTSMEMTNQLVDWAIKHGIKQVRESLQKCETSEVNQSVEVDEIQENTLDRLRDESDSGEFQPIQQSHNSLSTSLSSFLRNEAELLDQDDSDVQQAEPTDIRQVGSVLIFHIS